MPRRNPCLWRNVRKQSTLVTKSPAHDAPPIRDQSESSKSSQDQVFQQTARLESVRLTSSPPAQSAPVSYCLDDSPYGIAAITNSVAGFMNAVTNFCHCRDFYARCATLARAGPFFQSR